MCGQVEWQCSSWCKRDLTLNAHREYLERGSLLYLKTAISGWFAPQREIKEERIFLHDPKRSTSTAALAGNTSHLFHYWKVISTFIAGFPYYCTCCVVCSRQHTHRSRRRVCKPHKRSNVLQCKEISDTFVTGGTRLSWEDRPLFIKSVNVPQ